MNQDWYIQATRLVDQTATLVWDYMLYILLFAGIWLTLRTGFIQFRKFFDSWRLVLQGFMGAKSKGQHEGDISPFAALSTALAATVGNGNIGGVATALFWGGPGAIFWMWICGFFGMATKYSEALLGVLYREKHPDGTIAGGPMYYIKNGFKNKTLGIWLAGTFAIAGAIGTLLGTGNMMQSNQIALVFSQYSIPNWVTGVILTVLVALVMIGGIKRLGSVSEKLVPTMILIYLAFAIYILAVNIAEIPNIFKLIFYHAFTPTAAVGGFLGSVVKQAMQFGFRRGLLSNEAGLGSAPIAHSAAQTPSCVHQGLIGTMEVFIDTIIVCSLTAIVNLSVGVWKPDVTLQLNEIKNPASLIAKFRDAKDPASLFIVNSFSAELRQKIQEYKDKDAVTPQVLESLVAEMNLALKIPGLYDEKRFKKESLRNETQKIIERDMENKEIAKVQESDVIRINRYLLEDTYPGEIKKNQKNGTEMTSTAFAQAIPIPYVGGLVVAICSLLFGYTTIIGWGYYGEQCLKYLFGLGVTYPYRVVYIALTMVGSVISIELVFYIGDIANAIMALPNLFALIILSGTVASVTRQFFQKYRNIRDFDPAKDTFTPEL